MKFDDTVTTIGTVTDLRRISSAHVVDHKQLSNEELSAAIIKVKPQYLHEDTVRSNLSRVLYQDKRTDYRVLSQLILVDVLLDQFEFILPFTKTEERVIEFEQSIIDRSNETDVIELACGNKDSQRYRDFELYNFVLKVAWENEDAKTPDEVNLLRRLRDRLNITEMDHRLLEAKLGKYPKAHNVIHTRSEINEVRRYLQSMGLLFAIRQDNDVDHDVIPEELAEVLRRILRLEIRNESYKELVKYRLLRKKSHLVDVLTRGGVAFGKYDTIDVLVERVVRYLPPSKIIASSSPRYGLNSDQLATWCRELNLSASGSIEERVSRIITHFDQLRPFIKSEIDNRERWYEFYEELASRDYETLRSQHVIEKDLEVEAYFEEATRYLFAEKLNNVPLLQRGSNRPDGLLSLQSNYLMWDNKSKESPVNLKDHIRQFDDYMNQADKPVPVFLVVAPAFTEASKVEATRYHARHFDRNIALITADELKCLAEEWSSPQNKNREEPFLLGLFAVTGRFNRAHLGRLF